MEKYNYYTEMTDAIRYWLDKRTDKFPEFKGVEPESFKTYLMDNCVCSDEISGFDSSAFWDENNEDVAKAWVLNNLPLAVDSYKMLTDTDSLLDALKSENWIAIDSTIRFVVGSEAAYDYVERLKDAGWFNNKLVKNEK